MATEEFSWTAHPLKERPLLGLGLSIAGGALYSLIADLLADSSLAMVLIAALAWSLRSFFLPTAYHLTPGNLSITLAGRTKIVPLSGFAVCKDVKRGIFLSKTSAPTSKGILLLAGAQRQELMAFLERQLQASQQDPVPPS